MAASGRGCGIFSSRKRFFAAIAAAVVVAVVLGTVSGLVASVPPEKSPRPVVVMLVPLSGELAPMGEQLLESAKIAAEDTKVVVEGVDEGTSVDETMGALSQVATRPEVVAIIGPLQRRQGPHAARKGQQMEVPMVVYASHSGVEQGGEWVFRARLDAGQQARNMAKYVVGELEMMKIGVMAPRSPYGDALVPEIIEAVDAQGGRTTAMGRYEEGATDFSHALQVLTGQRAAVEKRRDEVVGRSVDRHGTVRLSNEGEIDFEALLILDGHDAVGRMLPFMPRAGIRTGASAEGEDVLFVGLSGWRGDGLARAGEHASGSLFFDTFGGGRDGAKARSFVERFQRRTNREPTTPEAEIYDLVTMIGAAASNQDGGSNTRRVVRQQLSCEKPYTGVTGAWCFDESGSPVRQMHPYRVVDGGDWVRDDEGRQ